MGTARNYLSLIKFSHTIFALPFALIGFTLGLAEIQAINNSGLALPGIQNPSWKDLLIKLLLVLGCMVFARSAAMAFNRYLDRNFDKANPRTAVREVPTGTIKANSALVFTIVSSLLFVACTFFINLLCFYLSFVALAVVLGYSYTKRFTPLCHLILGIGLSLAPIGAYLAVTGYFSVLPFLFSLAVVFWVSGFDIIYALQDEEFDKSNALYSIPAWVGKKSALQISKVLHLISVLAVIAAGLYANFSWIYWIGAAVFAGMLFYQHSIVSPDNLKRVNLAFMTANGIASIIFSVFVIADLLIN